MSKQEKTAKAVYAQPKLCVYGGFSQLTASGSINMVETLASPGMMMVRP